EEEQLVFLEIDLHGDPIEPFLARVRKGLRQLLARTASRQLAAVLIRSNHRSGCKSAVLGSRRNTQTSLRWPSAQTRLRLESYKRPSELLKTCLPIRSGPANFTLNHAFLPQSYAIQRLPLTCA